MLHTMKIIFTIVFIVLPLTALKGGTTAEVKLLRTSHLKLMTVSMYFKTYSGLYVHTFRGMGLTARSKAFYCAVQLTHTYNA
jgi:hypothetical protein